MRPLKRRRKKHTLWENSQFQDEDHLVLVLEGVMEVDKLGVVQVVHDVNLILHGVLVQRVRGVDELGHKHTARGLLYAAVDNAKCTAENTGMLMTSFSLTV